MLQVAIIGLGSFGIRMLEELYAVGSEIIIVDRDAEKIELYLSKGIKKEVRGTKILLDRFIKNR